MMLCQITISGCSLIEYKYVMEGWHEVRTTWVVQCAGSLKSLNRGRFHKLFCALFAPCAQLLRSFLLGQSALCAVRPTFIWLSLYLRHALNFNEIDPRLIMNICYTHALPCLFFCPTYALPFYAMLRLLVFVVQQVDNEHLGRKKSKCCCIYVKPRAFDESDSEDESDKVFLGFERLFLSFFLSLFLSFFLSLFLSFFLSFFFYFLLRIKVFSPSIQPTNTELV